MKKFFKNNWKVILLIIELFIIIVLFAYIFLVQKAKDKETFTPSTNKIEVSNINGLIYLINVHPDEPLDGLLKWEQELNERGITALIKSSKPVLEKHPKVFKRLSKTGHEIMVGNPDSCWDMPYDEQLQVMKNSKEYVENLTGSPLKVFACKYSSYDENTVKAAEELGIEYVLARGTEDVRALIYKPEEYDVKLLEVSNVEFSDMGRGSLCDISLFSRGSTAEDFEKVVEESFDKDPDSMILVSHPHIGGTKKVYWEVYEDALNTEKASWRTFEDFMDNITTKSMPYDQIPVNTEVKYLEPDPVVPLEELEDLPNAEDKIVMFHNGTGPMCKEAEEFLESIDYPVKEYLDSEDNFQTLLESYKSEFDSSEGVSEDFGYYPIIFIEDKAFSGFDDSIKKEIENIVNK